MRHEFVEHVPEQLEEGVVYVSMAFATAVHKCACGCGREVVTPLSPTDWKLTFDGESISLHPSIGNWSFPCRSHYWLRNNKVTWARAWTEEEIDSGRELDRSNKARFYAAKSAAPGPVLSGAEARCDEPEEMGSTRATGATPPTSTLIGLWRRVWRW